MVSLSQLGERLQAGSELHVHCDYVTAQKHMLKEAEPVIVQCITRWFTRNDAQRFSKTGAAILPGRLYHFPGSVEWKGERKTRKKH